MSSPDITDGMAIANRAFLARLRGIVRASGGAGPLARKLGPYVFGITIRRILSKIPVRALDYSYLQACLNAHEARKRIPIKAAYVRSLSLARDKARAVRIAKLSRFRRMAELATLARRGRARKEFEKIRKRRLVAVLNFRRDGRTLAFIGRRFGFSRERARQLISQARRLGLKSD